MGTTRSAVLATIARIAAATPLQVGTHQVTQAMLPGLPLTVDDSDASYAEFSAQVRVLRDAAARKVVTPTPAQEQRFQLYDLTDVVPEVEGLAGAERGARRKLADLASDLGFTAHQHLALIDVCQRPHGAVTEQRFVASPSPRWWMQSPTNRPVSAT
ncbi:hypothetical protein ACWGID_08935 [Kribbella sp. NPDC054772]